MVQKEFFVRFRELIKTITTDLANTTLWLREHNLLKTQLQCNDCKLPSRFYTRNTSIDLEQFRCLTCYKTVNIRNDTIFMNQKRFPLIVYVRIIFYYFIQGMNASKALT